MCPTPGNVSSPLSLQVDHRLSVGHVDVHIQPHSTPPILPLNCLNRGRPGEDGRTRVFTRWVSKESQTDLVHVPRDACCITPITRPFPRPNHFAGRRPRGPSSACWCCGDPRTNAGPPAVQCCTCRARTSPTSSVAAPSPTRGPAPCAAPRRPPQPPPPTSPALRLSLSLRHSARAWAAARSPHPRAVGTDPGVTAAAGGVSPAAARRAGLRRSPRVKRPPPPSTRHPWGPRMRLWGQPPRSVCACPSSPR